MKIDTEVLRLFLEFGVFGIGAYVAKSINDLNIKVAVVISQLSDHSRRIEKLEIEGELK